MCNLAVLKSLHIDLGQPMTAFDAARLARALQGYKCMASNPTPTAKLAIMLPLLTQLVNTLPSVCPLKHDCRMFWAAFCLAFACFLCSSKLTWETLSSSPILTVGSIGFATDGTFATIFLPSSKTDPFGDSITLTVPSVPHQMCAVKVLKTICKGRPPTLLFTLAWHLFLETLSCCLTACGISPNGYSGHLFQHRAATWVAANGADNATIPGLGWWHSKCFCQYVDKLAADHTASTATVLYANADQPLNLSTPAWHDL